jgi:phosphoribosylaminoimidazole-succinocarboxamide synthase
VSAVAQAELRGLRLLHRGKVRDTYDLGTELLIVATDRISVFDRVLPTLIPDKGKVLTALSSYWFDRLGHIIPNHLLSDGTDGWPSTLRGVAPQIDGRAMIVRRANRIDYECVVRGYLAGSGWAEYAKHGTIAGEPLPSGLREAERLPQPRFTPARKNESGHDENISQEMLQREVGTDVAESLERASVRLYEAGRDHTEARRLLLADTKFEFGYVNGALTLIDEALTPDSSRFWQADTYRRGQTPPSLDKQPVRDWIADSGWDRVSAPPELPANVVAATRRRYLDAYRCITGEELDV